MWGFENVWAIRYYCQLKTSGYLGCGFKYLIEIVCVFRVMQLIIATSSSFMQTACIELLQTDNCKIYTGFSSLS